MSFLLDTNICSAHLKQPSGLVHYFVQHGGGLYIPTIVLAELYAWAYRRSDPQKLLTIIEQDLLRDITVLEFDRSCALRFGQLQGETLSRGAVINPVDMLIAAVALVHNLTLVTHNIKHFNAIPNLRLVDWLEA
jgi:tRNA(fMet)-specific endonuclease VapC